MLDRAATLYSFPRVLHSATRAAVSAARDGYMVAVVCRNTGDLRNQFEVALHALRHDEPPTVDYRTYVITTANGEGSIRFTTDASPRGNPLRGFDFDMILESGPL